LNSFQITNYRKTNANTKKTRKINKTKLKGQTDRHNKNVHFNN
jgi:hypothetical protein